MLFTTVDRAAIKASGVLGLGFLGISVEELLNESRAKRKDTHKLPEYLTKKWFQHVLAEGLSGQQLWLKSS